MGIEPTKRDGLRRHDAHRGNGAGTPLPEAPAQGADTGMSGGDSYTTGNPKPPPKFTNPPSARGTVATPPPSAAGSQPDEKKKIAFEAAVAAAAGIDPPTGRVTRIRIFFERSLDHLRDGFDPEQKKQGTRPTEDQIIKALRRTYYDDTGSWPSRENREIATLIRHLAHYLETHAAAERLLGMSIPQRNGGPHKKDAALLRPEAIARRVVHSAGLLPEIEGYGERLPPYSIDTFRLDASSKTPRALIEEARGISLRLAELGSNESALAGRLEYDKKLAGDAARLVQRLWDIRNEMRLIYIYHDSVTDHGATDRFMDLVGADLEAWLSKNTREKSDREPLRRAMKSYIAHWLSKQTGDALLRLTFSDESLEYAIIRVRREISDLEAKKRFSNLAIRLVHSIVRLESRKSRLDPDAPVGTDDAKTAVATPLTRQIRNADDLAVVIGAELGAKLNTFYNELCLNRSGRFQSVEHARRVAVAFYELFFNYVRFFANTYGSDTEREIRARGIELPLIHAVFDRIEGSRKLYDDDALAAFREFFVQNIRSEEPAVHQLKPPRQIAYAGDATASFIPYDGDVGMREFVGGIGQVTADQKKDFESETGISWETLLSWGGIQTRPAEIDAESFSRHVEERISAGQREDVTTEPRTRESLDAILPAYFFIDKLARESGRRVDFFDYLCAIYPIARRIRAMAIDGTINITVPQFMRDLPFSNWGYATWARQILRGKFPTDVIASTLENHLRGRVDNPEYETIRRYASPLSLASGGGFDQYQSIYFFAAGLMRWKDLLDSAVRIYDSDDSQLTHPAPGASSRFRIQLEYDNADYRAGSSPASGIRRNLFSNARLGVFREHLNLVRNYIETIKLLPEGTTITRPDGTTINLYDLESELDRYDAAERANRAILLDRSATSAMRSDEDNEAIYRSYRDIQDFVSRVVYFTRVRGELATNDGVVRYQAVPFLDDSGAALSGGEFITVPIGDLANIDAPDNEARRARVSSLLRLRAIVGTRMAEGTMDRPTNAHDLREAASAHWPSGETLTDADINAYLRLDAASVGNRKKFAALLPKLPSTGGRRSRLGLEPFLPPRADDWQTQFRDFARERHITANVIPRALAAIGEYFRTVRGFYQHFYPVALRLAVEEQFGAGSLANSVLQSVKDFFGTISVATEARHTRPDTTASGTDPRALAEAAVFDYLSLFPLGADGQSAEVPVDMNLLAQFVSLLLSEHREIAFQRSMVIETARGLLLEHNAAVRRNHPQVIEAGALPEKIDGMLSERFKDFETEWKASHAQVSLDRSLMYRAYFRLLPAISKREPVSHEDTDRAISLASGGREPSADEISFLHEFATRQAKDIERLVNDLLSAEGGIASYARGRQNAGYVTGDGLVTLATSAAVSVFTQNVSVNIGEIARDVVQEAFNPYESVSKRMALSYRTLLQDWLANYIPAAESQVTDIRMALELIAEDKTDPPASFDEFAAKAAQETGTGSFNDVLRSERMLRLAQRLSGAHDQSTPTLAEFARALYEGQVVPNRTAKEDHFAAIEKELSEIGVRAASFAEKALAIFADYSSPRDTATFDETAARDLLSQMESGIEVLLGLHDEMAAIESLRKRVAEIVETLGRDPGLSELDPHIARLTAATESPQSVAPSGSLDSLESATSRIGIILARAEHLRDELEDDARKRISEIEIQRATAARDTAKAEAKRAHAEAVATMTAKIGKARAAIASSLKPLLRIDKEIVRGATRIQSAEVIATVDRASYDFSGFHRAAKRVHGFVFAIKSLKDKQVAAEKALMSSPAFSSSAALIAEAEKLLSNSADASDLELRYSITELNILRSRAQDTAASSAYALQTAERVIGDYNGKLLLAEQKLPISNGGQIPPAQALSTQDEDWSLNKNSPRRDPRGSLRERLLPIRNGRVISRQNGSHFLLQKDADTLSRWLESGRKESLFVRDIFGNQLSFEAGERGIRIASAADLQDGHPLKRMTKTLNAATLNNTHASEIVSRLAGEGLKMDGKASALFRSLLAVFAALPHGLATEPETLVERWAIANKDALASTFGVAANGWFVTHQSENTSDRAPKEKIHGTQYTIGHHHKLLTQFSFILEHPELRRAVFRTRSGEYVGYYIDITDADRLHREGGSKAIIFNEITGKREELDLRQHGIYDVAATSGLEAIQNAPEYLLWARLCHRIYADPALTELGWLVYRLNAGGLEDAYADHLEDLLSPIVHAQLGENGIPSLREVERKAVDAYRQFIADPAGFPAANSTGQRATITQFDILRIFMPESQSVSDDIINGFRKAVAIATSTGKGAPHHYRVMQALPKEYWGAVVIDFLAAVYFNDIGIPVEDFYTRADTSNTDALIATFVRVHTDLEYLKALRDFLNERFTSRPLPHRLKFPFEFLTHLIPPITIAQKDSVAHAITGTDSPWLPNYEEFLLPLSDRPVIDTMNENEIEARIDALDIVPAERDEIDPLKEPFIERNISFFRGHLSHVEHMPSSETIQQLIDKMPTVFLKMLLVLENGNPSENLYRQFFNALGQELAEQSRVSSLTPIQRIRFAYRFILDHRAELLKRAVSTRESAYSAALEDILIPQTDLDDTATDEARILDRVRALSILPSDKSELEREISEWKAYEIRRLTRILETDEGRGLLRGASEDAIRLEVENLSATYVMLRLIIKKCGLQNDFLRYAHNEQELRAIPDILMFAYEFVVRHRQRFLEERRIVARRPAKASAATRVAPDGDSITGAVTARTGDKVVVRLHVSEHAQAGASDLGEQLSQRLHYQLRLDPTLRRLAALISDMKLESLDPGFAIYLRSLFTPIGLTTEGRQPPYTLHEAQRQALKTYEDAMRHKASGDGRLVRFAPFVDFDEDLAQIHPETRHVGTFHIQNLMKSLSPFSAHREIRQSISVISFVMALFPEYAGAIAIMTSVIDLLPLAFRDAFDSLARECMQAFSASEDELRNAKVELRRKFVDLYHSQAQEGVTGHDAIVRALNRERSPGMTYARWLTGLDAPMANQISAIERFAALLPEFRRVIPALISATREALERLSGRIGISPAHLRIIEMAPELSGAVVLEMLLARYSTELRELISDSCRTVDFTDKDSVIRTFVEARENNRYIRGIREVLGMRIDRSGSLSIFVVNPNKPTEGVREQIEGFEQKAGMTAARFMTGSDEPWRPDFTAAMLPLSDEARIDEMTDDEIEARIDALGLAPEHEPEFGDAVETYLAHFCNTALDGLTRLGLLTEDTKILVENFTARLGLINRESFVPTSFVRSLLAIFFSDPTGELSAMLVSEIAKKLNGRLPDSPIEKARFLYRFMLTHRERIITAARVATAPLDTKIVFGGGKKSGSAPGSSPAPAAPASPATTLPHTPHTGAKAHAMTASQRWALAHLSQTLGRDSDSASELEDRAAEITGAGFGAIQSGRVMATGAFPVVDMSSAAGSAAITSAMGTLVPIMPVMPAMIM